MINLLPGLPLIESPLFPLQKASQGLTAEEERIGTSLHEKGYAVFDFPDADLDQRIARILQNLAPRYGIDFDDPHSDKTGGENRIQDAWKFDEDVRAIAANEAVLDLLSKLYGRAAFPFQTLNFPVGTQQDAHSDSVHFSSLPERFMCGVWLAMEDISAEAGPLFYLPGSHRWPIVTNALIGRRGYGSALESAQDPYGPAWQALCDAHGAEREVFVPRKGQALIWCANLLHGGSWQSDPRLTRWSQVTHYYFDDCIYYTPAFSDEAVGRLHLRDLISISDGQPRPNAYLGEAVRCVGRTGRGGGKGRSLPHRMMSRLFG
ncbi:phytanoyl-CoA dioxygenase family protein [Sphingomonas sp. QA11]|uniref:phytanoyl-CoA dioxygenase family protein n=1 Tax=Sphingomonas sp. QA11 TaxID=2950605 RepID=UPI00234B4211|nr:phytanoyl-CoA dioxygenase family protein [Sphingomonas sp. QA11]WCM25710.1 phytanoyl-CoA dioxygenase family protein [Sphingomonas sp. QA11]